MAALPAEALDFRNGEAVNAGVGEGFPDVVELEGLDDDGDKLHECFSMGRKKNCFRRS